MADKLHFALVSPEAELFSGEVDQVDIPGTEGDLGVLPNHSALMAAIRTGAITVFDGGETTQYFVQGGFADVTPDGLTVLAEKATLMADIDKEALQSDLDAAKARIENLEGEAALIVQQDIDGLSELIAG
ncbi:MAG: ATP synthase F1 subunit epsilon [Hellea sp.]|nr:ATP synthase F1 subunit epsilon [Hellea sp.]